MSAASQNLEIKRLKGKIFHNKDLAITRTRLGCMAISVGLITTVGTYCTVHSLDLLYSQSRLFVTIFGFFSVEGCGKRL